MSSFLAELAGEATQKLEALAALDRTSKFFNLLIKQLKDAFQVHLEPGF